MAFLNDYTLGKGKFYFREFERGTQTPKAGGFRRLGNVPEATVSQTSEKLDHTSSEGGINVKDASVTTAQDSALAFTTDNVSLDNLAMWFNSEVSETVEAGGAVEDEALGDPVVDTFYQLGESVATPQGARNISAVTLNGKVGAAAVAPLVAGEHYNVNLATGMVEILSDELTEVTADYTVPASTRRVVLGSNETLEGQLKFIADNPKGTNKDTYWPYVQLTPDGDYALIGTDWQTIGFTAEVLSAADGSPRSITEQR
jgi:voltage-gated potassium channel Kch